MYVPYNNTNFIKLISIFGSNVKTFFLNFYFDKPNKNFMYTYALYILKR